MMDSFRRVLKDAKNIIIITGAGVSEGSGVPTSRGCGELWRTCQALNLATSQAFTSDPSLSWEYHHYKRESVFKVQSNKAHAAIAEFEERMISQGNVVTILTQNIDGLHQLAGSKNVIEIYGSLCKTRCTKCEEIVENRNSPICSALEGKGAPGLRAKSAFIAIVDLPRCKKSECKGFLRPNIVWFGEDLDENLLEKAGKAVDNCDVCLLVGTFWADYPAVNFARQAVERGIPVGEFNTEDTPCTNQYKYHFLGPCSITIGKALAL